MAKLLQTVAVDQSVFVPLVAAAILVLALARGAIFVLALARGKTFVLALARGAPSPVLPPIHDSIFAHSYS
jgi:hypothetical protein